MRAGVAAALASVWLAGTAVAADPERLLFHAETLEGHVLASKAADRPFNPASVVKVGTTLWALDELGPGHRFTTVFGHRPEDRLENGVLEGDLVVHGGGDPDLQVENLFLVAAELNRQGVYAASGDLVVSGQLWCGWENGVETRIRDPRLRAPVAGARVLEAFDPQGWSRSTRASWESMARRRGLDPERPPRVRVAGGARAGAVAELEALVHHRSAPLALVVRRFNVYSNNDIVRLADGLGGAEALQRFLVGRVGPGIRLATASGERVNRMTARQAVELVRQLVTATRAAGSDPGAVLPVLGCDPGPTRRMFPAFIRPSRRGAAVVKTGTLTTTDGGVAVLAGLVTTRDRGEVVFAVAAPRTGRDLRPWRRLEQAWLLDLVEAAGGAVPESCGPSLPYSDTFARVEPVVGDGTDRRGVAAAGGGG